MKSRRSIAILFVAAFLARAELSRWVQDIAAPSRLQAVFFRAMAVGSRTVDVRRPPNETREELGKLIAATPADADLYALRAREDELQLKFAEAEADWKKHVELAKDKSAAELSLAGFYHRRLRPKEEVAALLEAGRAPSSAGERFRPVDKQQSWQAFTRIQQIVREQALPMDEAISGYRAWIAQYPAEASIYRGFLDALLQAKQFGEAEQLIADYRRAFPADTVFPVRAEASMAEERGSREDALRVYFRDFQPLWPADLIQTYFDLMRQTHAVRRYLDQARSEVTGKPLDLRAAARVFYYFQQQGELAGAQRALYEFRQRKESAHSAWTADELNTLANLFEGAHNYDEAARSYYALYSLPVGAQQERALAGIAQLLLTAPDQPIRFGSGDLSFYRDIATFDPGPGFLNGVLSLLFNSADPPSAYAVENQASAAYFHRARAAELIAQIDRRFPQSAARPALHARLIEAYVTYGDGDGVLREGRAYLAAFPQAAQRTQVALAMADAYARQNKIREEFALYDDLLKELAAHAENVPIGESAALPQPPANPSQAPAARSPEYARVLERYIARLVALKRLPAALALYRSQIDRNPNDPGLYERLAGFLEQNKLGADVEQTYRRAMAQFPDPSWSHKLARWYLRHKQTAQFDQLTREVVKTFSGTELEAYLADAGRGQPIAPVLFRQVNLYAHQRFPYDLVFVRNLIVAYSGKGTADPAARDALLGACWIYADDLRDRFFESLSRSGRLKTELAAVRPDSPGAVRFLAEAESWRAHFEAAAPLLKTVAASYPGDAERQQQAASIYRSLATYDSASNVQNTETAAALEQNAIQSAPRDVAALTRTGEIYADRELFAKAQPFWNRIAQVEPGKPDGYIDAATVSWDYYRFDDALRLITEARQKLKNPALYSFEAGAIYENERQYDKAVREYARGALAAEPDQQSETRLVELSLRNAQRPLVDALTSQEVSRADASVAVVKLRVKILVAEERREDLRQFLADVAARSNSLEVQQYVDETAGVRGFDKVQEQSKQRQIALTSDPVDKLEQQIALAHFYEGRKDLAAAARLLDQLYRSNPTRLGVVRATADFYWRTKNTRRAVDVLAEAADRAQAAYRNPLIVEAARKATDAGDTRRARAMLNALLQQNPFDAQITASIADTYAHDGDDRGLRDFYVERLKAIQASTLASGVKIERAAELRRSLIPVLTRLKDYAGAVDQYIEVLNRYPEDADLAREAALYASNHGQQERLVGFYEKTSKDSPRDFRWALVEARLESALENFPAAVAAYGRAAEIRPDRTDFYSERAALEERLLHFDEAASAYAKLYELSYHNSQWMEKLAAVRARQGQTDGAVKALNTALVEGRPPNADALFSIAARLESWNLLDAAREYAEKGVALHKGDFLAQPAHPEVYARILTRLRLYDVAYRKLAEQARLQPQAFQLAYQAALKQMGTVVAQYFTPEEKSAFAVFSAGKYAFDPAIQASGLTDLQAKALARSPQPLTQLQTSRLRFDELAAQLEAFWKSLPPDAQNRDSFLDQAALNYHLAVNPGAELRVLKIREQQGGLNGKLLDRFAELLARTPAQFDAAVSADPSADIRNAMATYALRQPDFSRALAGIAGRGEGLPPVWTRAYTGLTGLYFASPAPQVGTAFREALGEATIGERVGKQVDRDQQLAGDIWFYYGSRYGEYLGATKQGDPEDYLPSAVEARPGSADAYLALGTYYDDGGQAGQALDQYRHALELDARRVAAHNRIGALLWQQGKHDEAVAQWKTALDVLARLQDERHLRPTFWTDLRDTLENIGKTHTLDALRPQADRVLRTYVRRNGSFQADPLMQGAFAAAGGGAAGIAWIVDLAKAAPEGAAFLSAFVSHDWIPEAQRPVLYRALIDLFEGQMEHGPFERRAEAESELRRWQIAFIDYLIERHVTQQAQALLASIPEEVRRARVSEIMPIEVRLAAQTNTVEALLNRYSADSLIELRLTDLLNTANELTTAGYASAAQQVQEFVYTLQLESRQLTPATFLGLAEIRLRQNNLAAAVALLRRMTLVAGEPFDTQMDAARLLNKTGHPAEAIEFLAQRTQAVPWDAEARFQLAKARIAAGRERDQAIDVLRAVVQAREAPYEVRVGAAQALGEAKAGASNAGSGELDALASPSVAAAAAEKPYFFFARLAAAAATKDPNVRIRLLRDAVAINPAPEQPKIDLLRAALESKRWLTAAAVAQPFFNQGFDAPEEQAEYQEAMAANAFLPLLEAAQRAALARGLAEAYEHLDQNAAARLLYRAAQRIDPKDTNAAKALVRVEARLQRDRANEQRRPVVTVNLDQPHLVRPRLMAAEGAQR